MPTHHHASEPTNAVSITKACIVLHNVLRDLNPTLGNRDIDVEGQDGQLIPGAWRDAGVLQDVEQKGNGPRRTVAGKELPCIPEGLL